MIINYTDVLKYIILKNKKNRKNNIYLFKKIYF